MWVSMTKVHQDYRSVAANVDPNLASAREDIRHMTAGFSGQAQEKVLINPRLAGNVG
jgi:hypothetical protein